MVNPIIFPPLLIVRLSPAKNVDCLPAKFSLLASETPALDEK